MPTMVGLVGCGLKKRPGCHPASDLYVGPLFRSALAYSLARHDATYILSAAHGLLRLDSRVQSYDLPLSHRPPAERDIWAGGVLFHLQTLYPRDRMITFVLLAGTLYVRPIVAAARAARQPGWKFEDPLAHLGLFDRIRWLRHADARADPGQPRRDEPDPPAR